MSDLPPATKIVIIGAGPSGLAAATELRTMGIGPVDVLEREPIAGGIPRHCGHYPFGARELGRVLKGPDYAARLVAKAQAAGVRIHTGVTVTQMLPGPKLLVSTASGTGEMKADLVLVCTGVRESTRVARMIGGTKPGGVITTGTLQSMVYLEHMRPFRRPVILGTELVSFSSIMTCRHQGIKPVAMIEPNERTTARWPTGLFPRLFGIPLHLSTQLLRIEGKSRVESAIVRDAKGGERSIACDGVILTGAFRPENALLRDSHLQLDPASSGPVIDQFGRCSDPSFFAAGNLLRAAETAGWSWNEGRRVARSMARSLEGSLEGGLNPSDQAGPVRVILTGDAVRYCVPQRLAGGTEESAMRRFQLRVTRPVKGRLVMRSGGQTLISQPIDALPERRIALPFPDVASLPSCEITIALEEQTE